MSKNNKKNNKQKKFTTQEQNTTQNNESKAGIWAMIVGAICIILAIVLIACLGQSNPDDEIPVVTGAAKPAEYTATTHLISSWREDFEDGSKKYYITLAMQSDDYYAEITADDVQYLNNNTYVPLTEVFEGTIVDVYNLNDTQGGICSYAKIVTNELIDTKKIYVSLCGPAQYDPEALTVDAYVNKYGNKDGWCAMLLPVSSKTIPHTSMLEKHKSIYNGMIRLYTSDTEMYYYNTTLTPVTDGSSILTKFDIIVFKDCTTDTLIEIVNTAKKYFNIVDGELVEVQLDERLKPVAKYIDGELWIGFETKDGSPISEYDGEIPDSIQYQNNTKFYYFTIKQG